jgi:hypothetical protein
VTPERQQAAIALTQVRESTGLVISGEAAAAIRDDVLGGRTVRDPAGYLKRAIVAEAARDPALTRWLDPPQHAAASGHPSAGDRHPSATAARDVLDRARHPEGHDAGRGPRDAADVHRGADLARQMLDSRPRPAEAEAEPDDRPPVGPPSLPDPAGLRAERLAAEAQAEPDPPPDPPPEPPDEPEPPGPPDDDDIPF